MLNLLAIIITGTSLVWNIIILNKIKRPIVFALSERFDLVEEDRNKLEEELGTKLNRKVIILPSWLMPVDVYNTKKKYKSL